MRGCSIPWATLRRLDGSLQLDQLLGLVLNPWAWWQYAHNMSGAVITGAIVMAVGGRVLFAVGEIRGSRADFCASGVIAGLIFSVLQLFPTGDGQGRMIAVNQPVTLAAMEALFVSQTGAPLVIVGQPNVDERKIDNPLEVPDALSFLTYRAWKADVQGLDAFPEDAGRRTSRCFITATTSWSGWGRSSSPSWWWRRFCCGGASCFPRGGCFGSCYWPCPFLTSQTPLGWMTAELGRQPWLVYGLMRTADGYSKMVSAGNANVHAAGLPRYVHGAGDFVPVSGAA
jgi:cytochrome d ubiquinol oxidase subunit I